MKRINWYFSLVAGSLLLTSCFFGLTDEPEKYSPDLTDPNMVEYSTTGKNQASAYLNNRQTWRMIGQNLAQVVGRLAEKDTVELWLNGETMTLRFVFTEKLLSNALGNPSALIGEYDLSEPSVYAEVMPQATWVQAPEAQMVKTRSTSGKLFLRHAQTIAGKGHIFAGTFSFNASGQYVFSHGRFDVLITPSNIITK